MTNTCNQRLRTGLTLLQPTGTWTNSFGYDAAKRLTNVTSPAGTFSYTLAAASAASPLPKKLLLPNTSYITNTYDTMARWKGTYLKTSGNVLTNKHEYNYNVGHQRTKQTFMDGATYDYTYDKIGQLKVADSSVAAQDRGYLYDAAWNLSKRTNNGTVGSFTVDSKNQLTQDPAQLDSYDSNGNLVSRTGSYTYSYDDENQLTSWVFGTTYRSDFAYDGKGRLRKRTDYTYSGGWNVSSETRYVYDGMRVIQERSSANTPTVSYTRGTDLSGSLEGAGGIGGLLGRSHGYSAGNWSTHSFYHADGNGNITYLLNSTQGKVAEYRYDPFGNTISSSGSLSGANVYRFSSKEIHLNSGLYYYGYRFYDPNLQRWLNRDPLGEPGFEVARRGMADVMGDGPNLYDFINNNPISSTDPFGLSIWKCSRNTEWTWDGGLQHTYLWDDRPDTKGRRACGRDGVGFPGLGKAEGVSNHKDKGPGKDECVPVPNSDGKEEAVMGCCRTPRYKPFLLNDCHSWTGNCLTDNNLDDPYIYGRYKTLFDVHARQIEHELDF